MAKKLYVGNLSWGTTNDSLKDAFSKAGSVISATVMVEKMTGRSRGFGFVEIEDADADAAISMWNGKELDGRQLTVNEARPLAERPPRRDFDANRGPRREY
jgi:RNA recognition motif-containing protein